MKDEAIRTSPFVGALPGTGAAATQPCSRECTTYAEKTNSSPNAQASTVAAASKRQDMRDLVNVIRNWGKSFVKWPVAVDEPNGPNRGGCDTCRGLVTVHTNDARGTSGLHHRVLVHGPVHQVRSERSPSHRLQCEFTDLERCIPESRWLPRSDCLQ